MPILRNHHGGGACAGGVPRRPCRGVFPSHPPQVLDNLRDTLTDLMAS
nr:MAG TPA: hypothetical protein [Caudoviricetes sp.]